MDGMNQQNNGYGNYNANQGMNQETQQQNNGYDANQTMGQMAQQYEGYGFQGGMNTNNNNNTSSGQSAPDYILWLILGIVLTCTVCCCFNCAGPVFGIITIVLALMANSAFKIGNMVEYQSKIKSAKIVCIIGLIWLAVSTILIVLMPYLGI